MPDDSHEQNMLQWVCSKNESLIAISFSRAELRIGKLFTTRALDMLGNQTLSNTTAVNCP
jgi:hypothetical protein